MLTQAIEVEDTLGTLASRCTTVCVSLTNEDAGKKVGSRGSVFSSVLFTLIRRKRFVTHARHVVFIALTFDAGVFWGRWPLWF